MSVGGLCIYYRKVLDTNNGLTHFVFKIKSMDPASVASHLRILEQRAHTSINSPYYNTGLVHINMVSLPKNFLKDL